METIDLEVRIPPQKQNPTSNDDSSLIDKACPWVLLVEDDYIVRLVHKKMLTNLGCRVDTAVSGQEAIDMAVHEYDLILMDVGLPGISGIEATTEIRRRESGRKPKPIVALTAFTVDEIQQECLRAGANDVATKPINASNLQLLLEEYAGYNKF